MPFQDTYFEPKTSAPRLAEDGYESQDQVETAPPKTSAQLTQQTAGELETMMLFLRRARDRAVVIRENAPAGSYLESVLHRTILGIDQELAQLKYLLTRSDLPKPSPTRMRPAI
ncbi:hypothetical protein [Roseibium alexandrii]|uniref:hypothetical protein n=1 Tax=Roseibium alexandrii TaxID=388408 RepID=UPI003751C06C